MDVALDERKGLGQKIGVHETFRFLKNSLSIA